LVPDIIVIPRRIDPGQYILVVISQGRDQEEQSKTENYVREWRKKVRHRVVLSRRKPAEIDGGYKPPST